MVAISSMMIAYQVSKFILEVPTGYIADRFGRKTSGLVGVVGMLGYYAALLFTRSPLLLIGAFALKGFAVACVSGSIEAIYIDSVSQDQLVRLNVVERFVFYASYAISACVGGFISSVGAYLIGLSADIIAMVLTLVVVVCIPEMRRGDTAATPKRGISPKMIGAAIARNGILRSAFIMDCSQAFAFVALEDFFSLLLAGRGMNAVASGVIIAVQLLASASMGLIVPSVIAHVDKGRFARICGIVRLSLTALFLIPFTPVNLLPVFYVLQTVAYSLFAPINFSKCCRFFDALFTNFGPKPDGGGGRYPFLSVQCCVEQHRGHSSHIACSARDIFFGVYPRALSSYKSKAMSIWASITYISTQ